MINYFAPVQIQARLKMRLMPHLHGMEIQTQIQKCLSIIRLLLEGHTHSPELTYLRPAPGDLTQQIRTGRSKDGHHTNGWPSSYPASEYCQPQEKGTRGMSHQPPSDYCQVSDGYQYT